MPTRRSTASNRSYEYDGLGDAYVRFLLEELLPEVETKRLRTGAPYGFQKMATTAPSAARRAAQICAFTAAWERPDAFSRVFSAIGTYVGLRGGDRYPTLIRKTEPKPIRVYLQDGSNDLNIYGGDWWMANQTMERALVFAGLRGAARLGRGSAQRQSRHSHLSRRMRWLWRDCPSL